MRLKNRISYEKKEPFRDATLFIIVCEGSNTEPQYFAFFDRLTEKLKVVAVPSQLGHSAPTHMVSNAQTTYQEYHKDGGPVEVWIVIDVDKWGAQIHNLQKTCSQNGWNLVISNPCFEVWLNAHTATPSTPTNPQYCKSWKPHVHTIFGGFDPNQHPRLLPTAIQNATASYQGTGYMPNVGSTQVYLLGQKIYDLVRAILDE